LNIDTKKLGGPCRCGRGHTMETRRIIIRGGCVSEFGAHLAAVGLRGKCAAVYDENTYDAAGLRRPPAQQEIILPPVHLHADENAVARVLSQLDDAVCFLIAVGSGTIHDIVRYCAAKRGIPFVSCPTAASVDGFCSNVSAMTWQGFKLTLPGIAPVLVLADLEVIRRAPCHLARSGAGDMIGKYIALLDWNIAHLLTGEQFCPVIEGMTRQAVAAVRENPEDFEQLTYGLMLSGLAMQMMGNSRPASGAEHHFSHFIEMAQPDNPALHGEKVGIGAAIVAGVYHELAEAEDIQQYLHNLRRPLLEGAFEARLLPSILEENAHDCMAGVAPANIAACWPAIRKMVNETPSRQALEVLYQGIGAKATPEDIGLAPTQLPGILDYSPYVRNRLTLLRIRSGFIAHLY